MENIKENNCLIAKFMGSNVAFKEGYSPNEYHSCWNLLMPVIEKIGKLNIDKFPINITISTTGIYIAFNHSNCHGDHKEGILEIVDTLNINYFNLDMNDQIDMITSCWLGVVKFIEWYNGKN